MQSANLVTLPLILFELFPLDFVHHKNCVRSLTWKPLKLYSRNFIQISTNMSRCAECKINNSVIHTLWVISLGTLSITKTIIYDYFIPGYDWAIVNYIDRYLYLIRADCLHKMTRIVFNVSVWIVWWPMLLTSKGGRHLFFRKKKI